MTDFAPSPYSQNACMCSWRCKTIFPLRSLKTMSKMLIVKIRQLSIVYNHWTLKHAMTKKTSFLKSCIFIFWVN